MTLRRNFLMTMLLSASLCGSAVAQSVPAPSRTGAEQPQPPPGRERVPAAPNEAVVIGKVTSQCALLSTALGMEPERLLFRIRIVVEQVASGKLLRNDARPAVILLTREQPPLLPGKRVTATIEYRGDERGGAYWLKTIEEHREQGLISGEETL